MCQSHKQVFGDFYQLQTTFGARFFFTRVCLFTWVCGERGCAEEVCGERRGNERVGERGCGEKGCSEGDVVKEVCGKGVCSEGGVVKGV